MAEFYDHKGRPIHGFAKEGKKKALVGEIVTSWTGDNVAPHSRLPSQMNLAFDTSKLTIADYRVMREHPQISSSLAILSFMMYQREWHVVGDRAKEQKHVDKNLRQLWGRIPRAMSQAFWAGYSPCALQWENDIEARRMWITKIKDLRPETHRVSWKAVTGVADSGNGVKRIPIKVPIYDGIVQPGLPDLPVENSFWYPLLMENGDYYGRKLLNAAFQPWYFSMLMHLYSNRYMERFAEPTPVGRAPYDDKIKIGSGAGAKEVSGNKLMASLLDMQRNGSSTVLPNSRSTDGLSGDSTYDYTMEFLESQLRGVEFDRVIRMYDEEISMSLFTPLLMMRNGDVGSSNLGVVHTQTYMTMLNALGNDWEEYINKYIVRPMAIQNFGPNAKVPEFKFRPLGKLDAETLRSIIQAKIGSNWDVDLEEIGAMAGLTFKEVEQVLPDPADDPLNDDPNASAVNPDGSKKDPRVGRPGKNKTPSGTDKVKTKVVARISDQATKAFSEGTFGVSYEPDLGFRKQMVAELMNNGVAEFEAYEAYSGMVSTVDAMAARSAGTFESAEQFTEIVDGVLEGLMADALSQ